MARCIARPARAWSDALRWRMRLARIVVCTMRLRASDRFRGAAFDARCAWRKFNVLAWLIAHLKRLVTQQIPSPAAQVARGAGLRFSYRRRETHRATRPDAPLRKRPRRNGTRPLRADASRGNTARRARAARAYGDRHSPRPRRSASARAP